MGLCKGYLGSFFFGFSSIKCVRLGHLFWFIMSPKYTFPYTQPTCTSAVPKVRFCSLFILQRISGWDILQVIGWKARDPGEIQICCQCMYDRVLNDCSWSEIIDTYYQCTVDSYTNLLGFCSFFSLPDWYCLFVFSLISLQKAFTRLSVNYLERDFSEYLKTISPPWSWTEQTKFPASLWGTSW